MNLAEDVMTAAQAGVDLRRGAVSGYTDRIAQPFPLQFGFCFAGHAFEAAIAPRGDGYAVEAQTLIGRLPYSAEDSTRRGHLMRILTALNEVDLRWTLSNNQVIRVGLERRMDAPATATHIVAALVEHLFSARDYLELLAEFGRPQILRRSVGASPVDA